MNANVKDMKLWLRHLVTLLYSGVDEKFTIDVDFMDCISSFYNHVLIF